jgi:hypothetical protein
MAGPPPQCGIWRWGQGCGHGSPAGHDLVQGSAATPPLTSRRSSPWVGLIWPHGRGGPRDPARRRSVETTSHNLASRVASALRRAAAVRWVQAAGCVYSGGARGVGVWVCARRGVWVCGRRQSRGGRRGTRVTGGARRWGVANCQRKGCFFPYELGSDGRRENEIRKERWSQTRYTGRVYSGWVRKKTLFGKTLSKLRFLWSFHLFGHHATLQVGSAWGVR